jgi:peptide/nickel transport system substrate-binding protein
MRIVPAHLLRSIPRDQWKTAPFGRQPIGDGPYRFVSWQAGQAIELRSDTAFFLGRPGIRRLIWRFTPDLGVAVTQLIADQVDVREQLVTPEMINRVRAAPQVKLYPYPGNIYTYMVFNLRANGDTTKPHPIFGDREIRRALTMAVDRASLVKSTLGDLGKVPPGPMSSLLWIWDPDIRALPHDTAQAARVLNYRGWRDRDGDGVRDHDGQPLAFRVVVPTTKHCGASMRGCSGAVPDRRGPREIDEVDGSVRNSVSRAASTTRLFSRERTTPRPAPGSTQTWTSAGIGGSNYARYSSPAFDRLVDRAIAAPSRDQAKQLWRAAMETINDDAPAIFLYSLGNMAGVHARVDNVRIRPDSWAALLRTWRIPSDRQIDRDRVER